MSENPHVGELVRMRVSLCHNPKAGDNTSRGSIEKLIVASGHELVRVFDREAAFGDLVDDSAELVVAAGGDGTVAAAARLLAGRAIPLAILPVGTANNIARSLHGASSNEELVAGWNTATRLRVDLGVASGPWGERRFLEAVGLGLVPAVIESVGRNPFRAEDAASELSHALFRYRQVLNDIVPRRWTLMLDGERTTDDFILVEILNIGSVGPNVQLSPDADPSDGYFDVVTAREEHRPALLKYVQDRIDGRSSDLVLPTVRARSVSIGGAVTVHVDDQVFTTAGFGPLSISIEPDAVELLV